ncbi:uncharacterized protein LOC126779964 isoform X1 [Nymphalis io]|uniref:uncharacterized protein LOC126779964 isoform X1 n=1 Tax=Inachis io TaxID=171585 RepID=UPI00216A04FD|nr:uncharacterized protein LOC126779964 isoform X1 [Nymphalis io]
MPLKGDPSNLSQSYFHAKNRFLSLERRFRRDPIFKRHYIEFMREYENLGHMTLDSHSTSVPEISKLQYFIPHHGVVRDSSTTTKLRVVFDASASTSSGVSLNDIQMVGPVVQDDLFSILTRFRQHRYVVSGDVEKMYRAIELNPVQRPLQKIIFRFNSSEPLKTYTLNTVTYGTASAPYLATKCLTSLADNLDDYRVQSAIRRDFSLVFLQLLVSRNRIAPVKPTTIPRLELCGALLGARLCTKAKSKWFSSRGEVKPGSLVLIKDKTTPPLLWSLGRVTQTFPGVDGVTRVAEIKTKRGTIRRAFNNICPLPDQD